ncbi:MAG TPA: RNA 2',3'-cyclic phosphodiesterase [Humidesulfovibrio sp.]|uniref:RNA 2',3'-cyclic phosphodiesterase n=1 Tax=Humidesulfovibrio sp. TaxID=2910988 RepID=UPI002CB1E687|nr:RNA 2',3'-cyclic phosphodiesterase [Humidesulfovibrio sp.]HWR03467.1 RNA 2',3'-cyclic phosphodiesterase [Humidesulfovibrio sp.]
MGQDSGARASIRCFIGLPLPLGWQQGLDALAGRLAGRLASRLSWTRPDNWHVTLRFLGEVEEARLPGMCEALRGVDFAPFALCLGATGSFSLRGAPRTVWAGLSEGAEACARLARDVDRALVHCGFEAQARDFRPHVTLGRVKQAASGDDWEAVGRELAVELGGAAFGPALAGKFVLWRSILGPQGPKYLALSHFPARDHGGGPDGRKVPA